MAYGIQSFSIIALTLGADFYLKVELQMSLKIAASGFIEIFLKERKNKRMNGRLNYY
jgi:hypothetical protein